MLRAGRGSRVRPALGSAASGMGLRPRAHCDDPDRFGCNALGDRASHGSHRRAARRAATRRRRVSVGRVRDAGGDGVPLRAVGTSPVDLCPAGRRVLRGRGLAAHTATVAGERAVARPRTADIARAGWPGRNALLRAQPARGAAAARAATGRAARARALSRARQHARCRAGVRGRFPVAAHDAVADSGARRPLLHRRVVCARAGVLGHRAVAARADLLRAWSGLSGGGALPRGAARRVAAGALRPELAADVRRARAATRRPQAPRRSGAAGHRAHGGNRGERLEPVAVPHAVAAADGPRKLPNPRVVGARAGVLCGRSGVARADVSRARAELPERRAPALGHA